MIRRFCKQRDHRIGINIGTINPKLLQTVALLFTLLVVPTVVAAEETATVKVTHSALQGIGAEKGVMRRDPSDIIKVGDLYYVWYSKGKISPGYDATVWYATSTDGSVLAVLYRYF